MKPSARRRVEREVRKIMENQGDWCSICGTPFDHNSKTFGGVIAGGRAALAGECCKNKLKETILAGVYVRPEHGGVWGSVVVAAESIQGSVSSVDSLGAEIAKKAGILNEDSRSPRINMTDSPWKGDDAAWFEANPKRSHRLRKLLEGETKDLFAGSTPPSLPPGHEYQVLVRQVEPGFRVRLPFGRNLEISIPDDEPVIHALFDVTSTSPGEPINGQEVLERADRYAKSHSPGKHQN